MAPFVCPFCGCASPAGETCSRCKSRHALDGCISLFDYADEKTVAIIDTLKFQGLFSVCESIGEDLAELCLQIPGVPIVWNFVPAPMSKQSFVSRGFNQAEEISRVLTMHLGGKICDLLTMRGNAIQHTLQQKERWEMQQRQIRAKRFAKIPSHAMVVDDLKTTGATLDACAKALKSRGAKWVWAVTLASQKKFT